MSDTISTTDAIITKLPSTAMNCKALRNARKTAERPAKAVSALVIVDEEAKIPQVADDTVVYECCICGDDIPYEEGFAPCEEHFLCNSCVIDSINTAIKDTEAFLVQCCRPLPRRLVEHLLTPEVIEAYKTKAKEYYTSRVLRVYCTNDDCRRFIPDDQFDDQHAWFTVAKCTCGTETCVGCKQQFEGDEHRCIHADQPGVKLDWMPAYAFDYRIKQCPACHCWRRTFWDGYGYQPQPDDDFHGDLDEDLDENLVQFFDHDEDDFDEDDYDGRSEFDDQEQDMGDAFEEQQSYDEEEYLDPEIAYAGLQHYPVQAAHTDVAVDANEDGAEDDAQQADPVDDGQAELERYQMLLRSPEESDNDDSEHEVADTVDTVHATTHDVTPTAPTEDTTTVDTMIATPLDPTPEPAPTHHNNRGLCAPSDAIRQAIRTIARVPLMAPNPDPAVRVYGSGVPSFHQLGCGHYWHQVGLRETQYAYTRCP